MSDIKDLTARIDEAFSAVKDKAKRQQQGELQHYQERQKLFQEYEKVQKRIVEIAKPRLEAFAKRAGDRASVTPTVSESRRSAKFDFRSATAHIALTFSVAPDRDLKHAVVEYDLAIVPVLWRFDSHAEFSTPVAAVDEKGLTKWLDDRIVSFAELYIQIHEAEIYEKAEYVEDPIAKVKFPKFAAGATLEHGGQTHHFIDDNTKARIREAKGDCDFLSNQHSASRGTHESRCRWQRVCRFDGGLRAGNARRRPRDRAGRQERKPRGRGSGRHPARGPVRPPPRSARRGVRRPRGLPRGRAVRGGRSEARRNAASTSAP